MKKLLPAFALLIAPLAAFSQAGIKINGTTPVYIVENGGTAATPIYIEINNPQATNGVNPGIYPVTGTNGWIISESEFNMVKWDMTTGNTGTFTVPFGYSTTNYLPLTLTTSAIGTPPAGGGMKFSTWHTNADNGDNNTMASVYPDVVPSNVTNMGAMYNTPNALPSTTDDSYEVVDRFWIMDATGYSAAPTATNIAFQYIHGASAPSEVIAPNVFAEGTLLTQRFNSGAHTWGDWLGGGGNQSNISVGVGQVTSGVVAPGNFYRSWTLSSSVDPLPVTISSFTTQCDNGTAFIQWTAQTQLNTATFTVKKSADNIHFETVGTVNGAGTTTSPINYSLTDNSPYPGTSYYYLTETDLDNNVNALSKSQFTGCGEGESTTSVIGYNTTNFIQVNINSAENTNFNISLVNMLGQTVINENHAVALGENTIQLNNNVAPGIYILNVKNDKVNFTKKLVLGVK